MLNTESLIPYLNYQISIDEMLTQEHIVLSPRRVVNS